jgi:hypothetical protein
MNDKAAKRFFRDFWSNLYNFQRCDGDNLVELRLEDIPNLGD